MPENKDRWNQLFSEFVGMMVEIGDYGYQKHGENSTQAKVMRGDIVRTDRLLPHILADHSAAHFHMVLRGELHDHFGTIDHQLAACAFNAFMEFVMRRMERAPGLSGSPENIKPFIPSPSICAIPYVVETEVETPEEIKSLLWSNIPESTEYDDPVSLHNTEILAAFLRGTDSVKK